MFKNWIMKFDHHYYKVFPPFQFTDFISSLTELVIFILFCFGRYKKDYYQMAFHVDPFITFLVITTAFEM